MKTLFALALLAGNPGCWDCVGLSDVEIMMAYDDDYDKHVGDIPVEDRGYGTRTGSGAWGPDERPGAHATG
jgi:hypothetical protein